MVRCENCIYFTEIWNGFGNCELTKSMVDEDYGCYMGADVDEQYEEMYDNVPKD